MIEFIKLRYKNIQFYIRLGLISFLPILSYFGLSQTDITSWSQLGSIILEFMKTHIFWGSMESQSISRSKIQRGNNT